jgi:hypothetical protein
MNATNSMSLSAAILRLIAGYNRQVDLSRSNLPGREKSKAHTCLHSWSDVIRAVSEDLQSIGSVYTSILASQLQAITLGVNDL